MLPSHTAPLEADPVSLPVCGVTNQMGGGQDIEPDYRAVTTDREPTASEPK